MERLIDADEAKEVLTKLLYETALNNSGGESLMCEDIAENRLETWFGLVPSVDAEPVKHGHWTSSQGLAEVGEVQCSNCKTIYYAGDLYDVGETDENGIGQALMPNYCPHCGAKMEGEDV